jgi:hypothetical protein
MSLTVTYSNPTIATQGLSFQIARFAPGPTGWSVIIQPANGDTPFEFTSADLSAPDQSNLGTLAAAIIAAFILARGYTP